MFRSKVTVLLLLLFCGCASNYAQNNLQVGAAQPQAYLPVLKAKKVAVVAHHASVILTDNDTLHLVDELLKNNVAVTKIFGPEHGFRELAPDGKKINDQLDPKTQLPIISLYGKNRKPQPEHLADVDVVVFDLQDVGTRFYTYLSTLFLVMEACAEQQIPLVLLDRPNPNGHYVDGPVLELEHKSFVGMLPIPVVHGMTLAELATMINGEQWLENGMQCDLKIIPVKNYSHQKGIQLPVPPSPNLPNAQAIALYPSLCFMERTIMSVGRGTAMQFQLYGHPEYPNNSFAFTPSPNAGSKYPKLDGERCYGVDLRGVTVSDQLDLQWLLDAYAKTAKKEGFFLSGFERLSGTSSLRQQILEGTPPTAIRASWQPDLDAFKQQRKKYLLYPDTNHAK